MKAKSNGVKLKIITAGTWEIEGKNLRVVRSRYGPQWRADIINVFGIIITSSIHDFPAKAIQDAVKSLDKIICLTQPEEFLITSKIPLTQEIG